MENGAFYFYDDPNPNSPERRGSLWCINSATSMSVTDHYREGPNMPAITIS